MPVLDRKQHDRIERELRARFGYLLDAFNSRNLKNNREGAKGGHWVYPDSKCATVEDAIGIRLAVNDFKTILAEIGKLK